MIRNFKLTPIADPGDSEYKEVFFLFSEKMGNLLCWRDLNMDCRSDCAAWNMNKEETVVRCSALPEGGRQEIARIDRSKL